MQAPRGPRDPTPPPRPSFSSLPSQRANFLAPIQTDINSYFYPFRRRLCSWRRSGWLPDSAFSMQWPASCRAGSGLTERWGRAGSLPSRAEAECARASVALRAATNWGRDAQHRLAVERIAESGPPHQRAEPNTHTPCEGSWLEAPAKSARATCALNDIPCNLFSSRRWRMIPCSCATFAASPRASSRWRIRQGEAARDGSNNPVA
jgi:hypothetical protein